MADFTVTNQTKTAVMELTTPIASLAAYATVINDVMDMDVDNPLAVSDYASGGVTYDGISKNKESFTGKVVYTDPATGKTIGTITIKAPTASGFTGAVASVIADADIATDMGGVASHDSSDDNFSTQLKCHDSATDEVYYLTINRDNLRLTSYTADSILTLCEAWADAYPLA